MGRVIAIVNQKGGVGKSTTAVNVGAYLAQSGSRVLLVDIDPQGNASSGVGVDKSEIRQCMYNVLTEQLPLQSIIQQTDVEGLHVAPATISLAGAEIELVPMMSREFQLDKAVKEMMENYDYVLIDCPPSLGLLTINALTAADSVIVPIQSEYYALEGLSQLMNTIEMVQMHLNADLVVDGIVVTMFDSRTNLAQQVLEDVRSYFADYVTVFETVIPRNIRLSEAPSYGQPILLYDNRSKGAEAYRQLAKEVAAI